MTTEKSSKSIPSGGTGREDYKLDIRALGETDIPFLSIPYTETSLYTFDVNKSELQVDVSGLAVVNTTNCYITGLYCSVSDAINFGNLTNASASFWLFFILAGTTYKPFTHIFNFGRTPPWDTGEGWLYAKYWRFYPLIKIPHDITSAMAVFSNSAVTFDVVTIDVLYIQLPYVP